MPAPLREIFGRFESRLPQSGRIEVRDLLELPSLPPVVRGFLQIELEIAIGADLETFKSHFELPHDVEQTGDTLIQTGVLRLSSVGAADARKLLQQAVNDTVEYLSHPRSYLTGLFAGDRVVLLDDLFVQTLRHIKEYDYLIDVLQLWAARKRADGIASVNTDEFAEVVARVDRGMIGHYGLDRIEELLAPLAILFDGAIPKSLLADFFRDKSMHRVAARISSLPGTAVSIRDAKATLFAVHAGSRSNAGSVDRDQMLAELRAAGVVISPSTTGEFLDDIRSRTAATTSAHDTNRQ